MLAHFYNWGHPTCLLELAAKSYSWKLRQMLKQLLSKIHEQQGHFLLCSSSPNHWFISLATFRAHWRRQLCSFAINWSGMGLGINNLVFFNDHICMLKFYLLNFKGPELNNCQGSLRLEIQIQIQGRVWANSQFPNKFIWMYSNSVKLRLSLGGLFWLSASMLRNTWQ